MKVASSTEEDYGEYLGDAVSCWKCGGEGFIVFCIDDLCQGTGECMHGDGEDVCPICEGEGNL